MGDREDVVFWRYCLNYDVDDIRESHTTEPLLHSQTMNWNLLRIAMSYL